MSKDGVMQEKKNWEQPESCKEASHGTKGAPVVPNISVLENFTTKQLFLCFVIYKFGEAFVEVKNIVLLPPYSFETWSCIFFMGFFKTLSIQRYKKT